MPKATVIISTWRRPDILRKVLNALCTQTVGMSTFDVLVIDSQSADNTQNVVEEFSASSMLNVQLLHCPLNVLAAKRNYGMTHAKGDYFILLDDDCIPEPDHVESFLALAEMNKDKKIIYCGGVKFDPKLVGQSNYYRYRNQCHFSKNSEAAETLKFNNIVAMNMMIDRNSATEYRMFFDERFVGYGCEDMEYGWRSIQLGFKILPCTADILHEEINGDIEKFKKKIFHASRDGFAILRIVAPDSIANMGMTSLLEPAHGKVSMIDSSKRLLIRIILESPLPRMLERLLLKTDHISIFYSYTAFRLVLAAAHLDGATKRAAASQVSIDSAKSDGWYK